MRMAGAKKVAEVVEAKVDGKFDASAHLIDLKGKQYLPVAARIAWFRQEYFDKGWSIRTDVCMGQVALPGKEGALVIVAVIDDKNVKRASGHAYCEAKMFPRFVEKAETAAIGRALAVLGLGTLFAQEMAEDDEEFADAPIKTEDAFEQPFPSTLCARCKRDGISTPVDDIQAEATKAELGFPLCPPCVLAGRAAKKK